MVFARQRELFEFGRVTLISLPNRSLKSMVLTGPTVARALESTEAQHLARQVDAYRELTNADDAKVVSASGAVAAITSPTFGRKLNHVTGLGMNGPISSTMLAELEDVYFERGLDVEVDVCPHADRSVLAALAERSYHVDAFSNTYVHVLSSADMANRPTGEIKVISGELLTGDLFLPASIAGFSAQVPPREPSLLDALARAAIARKDTKLFAAKLEDEIVGTAAMSVIPTSLGLFAHLYIASTLPRYRRRGVQFALLQERLHAAKNSGCVAATVTARPANESARNAERAGFTLAYTKSTFVKKLERFKRM